MRLGPRISQPEFWQTYFMETVKTSGQPGTTWKLVFKVFQNNSSCIHVCLKYCPRPTRNHENIISAEINICWTISLGLDDFEMDTPVENSTSISTFYVITTILKVKNFRKTSKGEWYVWKNVVYLRRFTLEQTADSLTVPIPLITLQPVT